MFGRLEKAHGWLSEVGLWCGMAALVSIASLTFVATMSRYFLNAPIGWVPDWAGYLLAFSIFATAPAVTLRGQHVAMDILATLFTGPVTTRLLSGAAMTATLVILATMSWIVWNSLASAYAAGTATAAGYPIPRWWLLAVLFYGFASSSIHILWMLIRILSGQPEKEVLPQGSPEGF